MKRLTYEEVTVLQKDPNWKLFNYPYPKTDDWWDRVAEIDKYYFDRNDKTADWRIVDKKTNKEVYSYYTDFYNGEN